MERYKNLGGNSGVLAYEMGSDSITIQFTTLAVYNYTYRSAGISNIEKMKALAIAGRGLNNFIMRNVKKQYASKLR